MIIENVIPEPTRDRTTRTKVFRRLKSGFSDAAVDKGVVDNGAMFLANKLYLIGARNGSDTANGNAAANCSTRFRQLPFRTMPDLTAAK
jgi:hypothetical protein